MISLIVKELGMFYDIQGFTIQPSIGCIYPSKYIIHKVVNEHKNILDNNTISESWLKDKNNVVKIIRYYANLNKFKELNKYPMFNIVPICRIGAHFMTIDSYVLYGIMKELKIIDCNEATFIEMSNEHWSSFLKIDKLQGENNEFTRTIETDGDILHVLKIIHQKKNL